MTQSAEQLASKITTGPDGTVYGPNGTPVGKAAEPEKSPAKLRPQPQGGKKTVAAKSAPTAKASKSNAKTPAKKPVAKSDSPDRSRSVGDTKKTVGQRRLAAVKALRSLGATSPTTAVTVDAVAKKSGLTRFDAYGQLYHTHKLQAEGFVKQVQIEGVRGASFHLTAKGAKATDDQVAG